MSASRLALLAIRHLRGSVQTFLLPFEKGKKLTVVYGENGTGKSTICDAFELLGRGQVSSLEGRGLGRTSRYWPSLGKGAADILVTLETADSVCTATLGKSDEVVITPPSARPRVEVFRKSQILSLIDATPGDRYAAIGRFIDVSGVEASEGALRNLIRTLKQSREVAVARLLENESSILQFWEAAGGPAPDPFAWATTEATRDPKEFDAEIAAIEALRTAYTRLTDYPGDLRSAEQAVASARSAEEAAAAAAQAAQEGLSEEAPELVGVLQAARDYLAKHTSPLVCPLCESSDRVADLAIRVEQRLGTLVALEEAHDATATVQREVTRAEARLQRITDDAIRNAAAFDNCRALHAWGKDVPLPSAPAPTEPSTLVAWVKDVQRLQGDWRAAAATRYDRKQFISTLRQALKTWTDNRAAQELLDRLLPRFDRALAVVEEERRALTDSILASIATEVSRLYEAVHPGEGLSKISLELDPKKRASLEIGASFLGTDTRPQAYFSDSHLDTLGLCVFLALAALDEPADAILVLDDVLASVDEPHVERLVEMLYAETLKFRHCIITTHYRPWKHKLRWGWLQNGQCQFIELTKWTPTLGLTLTPSIPEVARLRKLLGEAPADAQAVSAKAGVILEAALDFLTQHYECAVPRRPGGRYTLGDLLPAVDKKLRQALRIEVLTGTDEGGTPVYKSVSLAPYVQELTRIAQVRNLFGCHFSELSFDLLEADAIGFGQQVLELMDVLLDLEAGWPRNGKSGEYWATAGETRRLYPFRRPF